MRILHLFAEYRYAGKRTDDPILCVNTSGIAIRNWVFLHENDDRADSRSAPSVHSALLRLQRLAHNGFKWRYYWNCPVTWWMGVQSLIESSGSRGIFHFGAAKLTAGGLVEMADSFSKSSWGTSEARGVSKW